MHKLNDSPLFRQQAYIDGAWVGVGAGRMSNEISPFGIGQSGIDG